MIKSNLEECKKLQIKKVLPQFFGQCVCYDFLLLFEIVNLEESEQQITLTTSLRLRLSSSYVLHWTATLCVVTIASFLTHSGYIYCCIRGFRRTKSSNPLRSVSRPDLHNRRRLGQAIH